jgi:hypothetical protein
MQVGFWDTIASGASEAAKKVNWGDALSSAGSAIVNAHAATQVAKINAKANKLQSGDYLPAKSNQKYLKPAPSFLSENAPLIIGAVGVAGVVLLIVKMSAKKGAK